MNFSYTGSGNLKFRGCPKYRATTCLPYRFKEGSKAFICDKARKKGILEFVYVKKVLFNQTPYSGYYAIVYIDTWNGAWLEHELCTEQEAINKATIYWQRQLRKINNKIDNC